MNLTPSTIERHFMPNQQGNAVKFGNWLQHVVVGDSLTVQCRSLMGQCHRQQAETWQLLDNRP